MRNIPSTILFVTTILALTITLAFPPLTASAEGLNKYSIEAKLNFERASLEVKETVTYSNRTSKPLTTLVFNVTPAHFRAYTLKNALVGGVETEARMDGVVMELPLSKPLLPRQTIQAQLEFSLDVPQRGGRFGMNERVLSLGNWYPVLAVYRDGWDRHRYNAFGDPFFTEASDYDVELTVSSDVKVAHSGELIKHEGNVWQIRGSGIRDFALAISDRYETRTAEVGGTTITAFYLPEHRPAGSLYVEATARSVKWLNEKLAPYPSKSLHIAETVSSSAEMVGQEYPGIVFIGSSTADKAGGLTSYLAYLVAHEVAHQWFYSMVGNDQMNDPWLDEALATFLGYQVLEWAPLNLSSPSVVAAGNAPVDISIYDSADEGRYAAATYGKGAVFLQDLQAAMGSENLYKMLRRYVELYREKIATPHDFFSLAQSFTNTNLNPLIRKYFSYSEYKGDGVFDLEVKWPSESTLTGGATLAFEANAPVVQATVDVDGRVLLKLDDPSSPLNVDLSQLDSGDYLLRFIGEDANGRVSQQAQRIMVNNPPPTPVSVEKPKAERATDRTADIVRAPNEVLGQIGDLTQNVNVNIEWAQYLVYFGGFLVGLAALALIITVIRHFVQPQMKLEYPPRSMRYTTANNAELSPAIVRQSHSQSAEASASLSSPPVSSPPVSNQRPPQTPPSLSLRPMAGLRLGESNSLRPAPEIGVDPMESSGVGGYGIGELEELETAAKGNIKLSTPFSVDLRSVRPRREPRPIPDGPSIPYEFQPPSDPSEAT